MSYRVYMLASKKNGVLYVGLTNNILRRLQEHKSSIVDGFTKKYKVKKLVYVETYTMVLEAIAREKQLKKRNRQKKIALIEKDNIDWNELFVEG